MASLRGGQILWGDADGVGEVVLTTEVSQMANVGDGPYVAIYIDNQGAVNAVFDIQVGVSITGAPGRNAIDESDPDGGLVWYPYQGATALAVAAGDKLCFDLSPFAPPLVRLIRADGGASTDVYAVVSSTGPN